jgi:hypothetical protein
MEQNVTIPVQGIMDCTHIQIDARYDKGDYRTLRGYYVVVKAVKIEPAKYGNFNMVTCASDYPYKRYLVEQTERKSQKRLADLVKKVQDNAQAICDAFKAGNYNGVWAYV